MPGSAAVFDSADQPAGRGWRDLSIRITERRQCAFDSAHTMAVAQVCEQRGVPLIINIAAAPNITEQGFHTVFRNFPTAARLTTDSSYRAAFDAAVAAVTELGGAKPGDRTMVDALAPAAEALRRTHDVA